MRPLRLVCVLALGAGLFASAAPAESADRLLMIVLDAVPFETMERLTAPGSEALFPDFAPPVPLISTFPSSTSIALPGILGAAGLDPSPGYEARFFDWEEERRGGGGPVSYFRVSFPWRQYFDWNRKGPLRSAVHAARPVRAGIGELDRALRAFEAGEDRRFTIYVADTDTAGHLFGPAGIDPILRALDAHLRALLERRGPELRILLLSDHGLSGGEPLRNVLPAVHDELSRRGWRRSKRLGEAKDVVLTPYGLVSSFEAYAREDRVAALQTTLASVDGVDLCVARREGGWRLESSSYAVDFERRERGATVQWRWRISGDRAAGVAEVLGRVTEEGAWVGTERLLEGTARSSYPDPLHRLAGAFASVENPASVVCSVAEGHMYGAVGTERVARWTKGPLRWTHGALGRRASLGFLMTNRVPASLPRALRYDRALEAALERPMTELSSP